ncbi:FecR family protein [Pedobacter sp. L105]|uniref:FecR family protein n=1 Tax=Pedobacter sp. L105 TaxID=1641871 RepID=UPI00131E6C1D|nr:FecR domain-containing protein [Pedobacter sp. L105]
MDELLAKYMLGEATAAEIEAVDRWVFASEDNLKYFTHFKLIWETSRGLKIESNLNTDDSWAEFKQLTERKNQPEVIIRPINTYQRWMKIAAIWIAIMGISGLMYTFLQAGQPRLLTLQSYQTVKTDTLSDGSIVTLNKNSLLTYPEKFKGDTREIKLTTGEAFFMVAHNKSKPFIIHLDDAIVKVVGTSFNIKKTNAHAEVIVESGIVQVIHKKVIIRLKPQEKADIDYKSGKLTRGTSTDKLYNYYRTQEFVANKTPLWRIVKVLNSVYHVNIEIADQKLAARTLTTTFKTDSLDKILAIIAETFNARIVHQPGKIIIQ